MVGGCVGWLSGRIMGGRGMVFPTHGNHHVTDHGETTIHGLGIIIAATSPDRTSGQGRTESAQCPHLYGRGGGKEHGHHGHGHDGRGVEQFGFCSRYRHTREKKHASLPINNAMMEPNRPNEENQDDPSQQRPARQNQHNLRLRDKTRERELTITTPPPPHRVCPFIHRFPQQLSTVRPSPKRKSSLPRRPKPKRTGVTGPQHGRHPSTGVPRPTNHTRPSPGRTRARGGGLGPLTQPCGERGQGGKGCTCTFEREEKKCHSTQPSPDRKTKHNLQPPHCLPLLACQSWMIPS